MCICMNWIEVAGILTLYLPSLLGRTLYTFRGHEFCNHTMEGGGALDSVSHLLLNVFDFFHPAPYFHYASHVALSLRCPMFTPGIYNVRRRRDSFF